MSIENTITIPEGSLVTDTIPLEQPSGTHRYALNMVKTEKGMSIESSNESISMLPSGYIPLGGRYLDSNTKVIISNNPVLKRTNIGLIENETYISKIDTGIDEFTNINHQIEIEYRTHNGQRIIYWVDGNDVAKKVNLDRLDLYYTTAYKSYLEAGGNPQTYSNEKWSEVLFTLVKTFSKFPTFESADILDTGSIDCGSYSFAIQLLDSDMNPTKWINVSLPINIFPSNKNDIYGSIHGAKGVDGLLQYKEKASKSIKLTVGNLDEDYNYYRLAIMKATNATGTINSVLVSQLISLSETTFTYSGNDSQYTETSLIEIGLEPAEIFGPRHIKQIENLLVLGNGKDTPYDWCAFQKYASKIDSNLFIDIQDYALNSNDDPKNPKNVNSSFKILGGHMPGCIYSYGVVYLAKSKNGIVLSPSFHIPGKGQYGTGLMDYHPLGYDYPDIHNCLTGTDYWGSDYLGNSLVNTPVRHHKFPTRRKLWLDYGLDASMVKVDNVSSGATIKYLLTTRFQLTGATWPKLDSNGNALPIQTTVNYKLANGTLVYGVSIQLVPSMLSNDITIYDDMIEPVLVSTSPSNQLLILDTNCELYTTYLSNFTFTPSSPSGSVPYSNNVKYSTSLSSDNDGYLSKMLGIEFSNIEKPHPDVIGFFIVRHERTDEDKIIIDNAILSRLSNGAEYNTGHQPTNYRSFSKLMPSLHQDGAHSSWVAFYSLDHQYLNKKLPFTKMEVQGYYDCSRSGSGFAFNCTLSSGVLTGTPSITSGGSGYPANLLNVVVPVSNNNGVGAKVSISTNALGVVTTCNLITGGTNYSSATGFSADMSINTFGYGPIAQRSPSVINNISALYGILTQDVQPGTTFNPDVNKGSDSDGFDLFIGYDYRKVKYHSITQSDITDGVVVPDVNDRFYLNPATSVVEKDGVSDKTIYNTCLDNKIGIAILSSGTAGALWGDPSMWGGGFSSALDATFAKKLRLPYVSLINEITTSYSDFMTRAYYKVHNNPVMFENNTVVNSIKLYSGDSMVQSQCITSSNVIDIIPGNRTKKNKVLQIIVSVVALVGAAALIATGIGAVAGIEVAATAAATLVSTGFMVAQYAISYLISGIKMQNLINMYESDYGLGLKQNVLDGVSKFCMTLLDKGYYNDDVISVHSQVVNNIYFETSLNIALRLGLSTDSSDFFTSPESSNNSGSYKYDAITNSPIFDNTALQTYLVNKFTSLDRDRKQGRLYKGYAQAEYYQVNLDYMRMCREKIYYHLPITYDCCTENISKFKDRLWNSQKSFQEETIDNYSVFLPNNYRDIEAEHGEITGLSRIGRELFVHVEEGLYKLPYSLQERSNDSIISYIGTDEFFSLPPVPINTDTKGEYGTKHSTALITTKYGIVIIDSAKNKIYLFDGSNAPSCISELGNEQYFKNNIQFTLVKELEKLTNNQYTKVNNPSYGLGYITTEDYINKRLLITKRDYSVRTELTLVVENFPLTDDLNDNPNYNSDVIVYNLYDENFYRNMNPGNNPVTIVALGDTNSFIDCSWTMSFTFRTKNPSWVGWHSYIPIHYIHSKDGFYQVSKNLNTIWKHGINFTTLVFNNVVKPAIFELVAQSKNAQVSTFENLEFYSIAERYNSENDDYITINDITFNKVLFYTNKQSSGQQSLLVKNQTDVNYLSNQTINQIGVIVLDKVEQMWKVNNIRDYVGDYNETLFKKSLSDIESEYPIDKIVNLQAIDFNKFWTDVQMIRDKFLIIRLEYLNFADNTVSLTTNHLINSQAESIR